MSMKTPPSSVEDTDAAAEAELLKPYLEGEDRYIRFAEDILGLRLSETQKRVCRAVAKYQRVLVVSGNGVGKSYGVAGVNLGFLFANLHSLVMLTSGSYAMLTDTTWKPMQTLHKRAEDRFDLPGRRLQNPPRLELPDHDEWYFKAISPTNPDSLEGRHANHMLVVIEEADKPEITEEHLDSAGSSITDDDDRMIVVANPPRDEANIVYDLKESDRWHTIQFSSFDSHNVQVDAGELDGSHIHGLVDLPTVAEDWEAWNGESWPDAPEAWARRTGEDRDDYPGVTALTRQVRQGERAREWVLEILREGYETAKHSDERRDLSTRWYRRRLGIIPPDDATVPRPFRRSDVSEAVARWDEAESYQDNHGRPTVDAIGIDVARGGGDRNVVYQVRNEKLVCAGAWEGSDDLDHVASAKRVKEILDLCNLHGPIAVDAVGEGSGLADILRNDPEIDADVIRFNAGAKAQNDREYKDRRTEALVMLGEFLKDDGAVNPNADLVRELREAARTIELEEKTLKAGTVFKASSKDELKEPSHLGRSPDHLDAATLAVWAGGGLGTANDRGLVW